MSNLQTLAQCNVDDILIFTNDNILMIDNRYLTTFRPSYDFTVIVSIIENSFNNVVDQKLIESALDGLFILTDSNRYSLDEKKQLTTLHQLLITNNITESEIEIETTTGTGTETKTKTKTDTEKSNMFMDYVTNRYYDIKYYLVNLYYSYF
jgi:hypothetical protein